ncbi:MAG: DUF115 domain-containing protein [Treponema sp.]|nr:DUF115 domain-containing protein [Treponema sp.]
MDGSDTVFESGMIKAAKRLHSRYPQAEADRYIQSLKINDDTDYCILIEPGLGYLADSLRRFHPNCIALALHADAVFRYANNECTPSWYPGCIMNVQEFLDKEIPETASVQVIEWKASLNTYGESYLALVRETAEFLKRKEASRRTICAFGRRWVRNFFKNLTLLHRTLMYRTMECPIVITGSGPSLETAIPCILSARENIFLLAASSSLPALAACGIQPDMAISTDGGAWARLHLFECERICKGQKALMLAIALTAALPSQCASFPVLPINDGSLWQSIALSTIKMPSVHVPGRGTVSASAIELALALSSGSIYLAGMDLSVKDIQSHARPYGFDWLFFGCSYRLNPMYSQIFKRSNDIRSGGSHAIYAEWFKNNIPLWPKRIFLLGSNHSMLECLLPKKKPEKKGSCNDCFTQVPAQDDLPKRRIYAVNAILTALEDPRYSASLTAELGLLLFPSGKKIKKTEIAAELRSINGMIME